MAGRGRAGYPVNPGGRVGFRKVVVEGLGPVKRAEIELAPLIVLVGDNNTGKSWVAQLLWGLMNGALPAGSGPGWDRLEQALRAVPPGHDGPSDEVSGAMAALWPEVTESLRRHLPTMVFGPGASMGRLSVERRELRVVAPSDDGPKDAMSFSPEDGPMLGLPTRPSSNGSWALAAERAIQLSFAWMLHPRHHPLQRPWLGLDGLFFPASRTGFSLLYRDLAAASLSSAFGGGEGLSSRLTAPVVHFLANFATASDSGGQTPYAPADLLEQITRGRVAQRPGNATEWTWRPDELDEDVPLSRASSLVTELLPIIGLLRAHWTAPFVVIEEPEVHLHPAAQRQMARAIARLVRLGKRVIVTTHGDYLVQNLNNLIKLGARPDRADLQAELGLEAADYLLPDEVRGYGFAYDPAGTVVEPLTMLPGGLRMPTFNDELNRLQREIERLDEQPHG